MSSTTSSTYMQAQGETALREGDSGTYTLYSPYQQQTVSLTQPAAPATPHQSHPQSPSAAAPAQYNLISNPTHTAASQPLPPHHQSQQLQPHQQPGQPHQAAPTPGSLRHKQIYRMSSLGKSLVHALTDLVKDNDLSYSEAFSILDTYDRSFLSCMERYVDVKCKCTAHLQYYRDSDSLWTFQCKDMKFTAIGQTEFTHIDIPNIKIVATESVKRMQER